MPSFEAVRRRNLDLHLIETIKQVGVSNYSLISRLTGLNAETVRYKVNKHLEKLGLNPNITINFGELGLVSGVLIAKANPSADAKWIDELGYVNFAGKVSGADQFVCFYAVPFRFKKKYVDKLSALKGRGVLVDFEAIELYWVRYPPFRTEFYNFEEKKWDVDWNRVDLTSNELGMTAIGVTREPSVDYFDVRILREMQDDPTTNLTKIAKKMNANPRTVRYHHLEHVLRGKFVLGNNMRWVRPLHDDGSATIMQGLFRFDKMSQDENALVRRLFNKLPFTWFEAGTEDRSYFALLDIPMESFHQTVRFLEEKLESRKSRPEMLLLDPKRTRTINLQADMFDQKWGWRLLDTQPSNSKDAKGGENG